MNRDADYTRMNRAAMQVTITLNTGVQMRGTLSVSKQRTLQDELNKGETFIEFETLEGQKIFLARTAIAAVREFNIPRTDQMIRRIEKTEQFDPYEMLGLQKGASAAEIRSAYVALAKIYHPDRFRHSDLPPEVSDYVSAMATRINLAYSELRMTVAESKAMTENAA
jgi:preprotein translocase subunit Sec63